MYDQNVLAVENYIATLIDDFACFHDSAEARTLRIFFFSLDCDARVDRIAYENRLWENACRVISVSERYRIGLTGRQPDSDRERHCSVSDALAERSLSREFRVHVMRKEISGVAGVYDDIGLRDGPARGFSLRADGVVLEIFDFFHAPVVSLDPFQVPFLPALQHSKSF